MDLNIDYYHKHKTSLWILNKLCNLSFVSLILRLRPLNNFCNHTLFPKRYYDRKIKNILSNGAEYVGFSINFTNILTSVALARRLKKIDPQIKIIFGGFSFLKMNFQRYVLKSRCIDHLVVGEGEEVISDILKGVYSKNKKYPLVNLEKEPTPDYSSFDLDKYLSNEVFGRALTYLSLKGCKNSCTFCIERKISGRYRFKSTKKVFEDIKILKEKYNFNWIFFNDSIFMGGLKRLETLCDLILKEGIQISFGGLLSLREYDENIFKKMKKAGCIYIVFGLESGCQKILNDMKKGTKIEKIEQIIRSADELGIRVTVPIIVGYPTEDWGDYYTTIKFLFRNRNYIYKVNCSPLIIHRGSELYNSAGKLGIKVKDDSMYWHYKGNNYLVRWMRKWIIISLFKIWKSCLFPNRSNRSIRKNEHF